MDYFAIATIGYYPTPTPTASERMAFAASWGYLSVVPSPPVVKGIFDIILGKMGNIIINDNVILGVQKCR